jgi:hypothetical protein
MSTAAAATTYRAQYLGAFAFVAGIVTTDSVLVAACSAASAWVNTWPMRRVSSTAWRAVGSLATSFSIS